MDWGTIILDIILTVFFYLLVPVIFCIRNKPMTKKQINKVIWINGAILWCIFRIISIAINGEPGTGAAVFLWSWVGQKIMQRVLLKGEENEGTSESTNGINNVADKATINDQPPQTRYYCSNCGGLIDDNTRKCTECGKQHSKRLSKNAIILIVASVLLICIVAVFALVGIFADNSNDLIEYESYYVGVRTITLDNEAAAEAFLSIWENNGETEEAMIALLNEYGASQGGGQLYLVEQGEWIDEVDAWCFDRSRKIGDVAIIKNDYGYTICYFSSVVEREFLYINKY